MNIHSLRLPILSTRSVIGKYIGELVDKAVVRKHLGLLSMVKPFSPTASNRGTKSSSSSQSPSSSSGSGRFTVGGRKEASLKSIKSIKSNSSLESLGASSIMMKVYPIRALQDNYMYLLVDDSTKEAAAIDPVNASAMASAVADHGVNLKAILTTHHHHDHAHGNADMMSMFPDITIYGGDTRVQALTRAVSHCDIIKLGNMKVECLATPCHTRGHICYYVTCSLGDSEEPERAVFTGDTLFIAGCGRFFEGNSEQMNENLNNILGTLPDSTKVYCGHEYTLTNLKFALSVEPSNVDIKSKLQWAQNKISKREPTVPSSIGEEKKINPFMRLNKAQVKKFTGETEELEVMTVLRHRKNEFQP